MGIQSELQPSALVVVPWLVLPFTFVTGVLSFYLSYSALFISFIVLGLMFVVLVSSHTTMEHPDLRTYSARSFIQVLTILTVFVSLTVGIQNYHRNRVLYISSKTGREYTNVALDSRAATYADAGIITFDTPMLDDRSSVGLRAYAFTACVTPIAPHYLRNDVARPPVEFWAVGEDCCSVRGEFICDGALDLDVTGGLVVHKPSDATTSSIFAPKSKYYDYMEAVQEAAALNGLKVPEEPLLVRWVARPEGMLQEMHAVCVVTWLGACIGQAILVTAAYVLYKNTLDRGDGWNALVEAEKRRDQEQG